MEQNPGIESPFIQFLMKCAKGELNWIFKLKTFHISITSFEIFTETWPQNKIISQYDLSMLQSLSKTVVRAHIDKPVCAECLGQ